MDKLIKSIQNCGQYISEHAEEIVAKGCSITYETDFEDTIKIISIEPFETMEMSNEDLITYIQIFGDVIKNRLLMTIARSLYEHGRCCINDIYNGVAISITERIDI